MSGIHNYAGFIAAVLIFQLIPGPGTLAILKATARNGIGAGMGAVGGTLAGDMLFMLAAVLGLAAALAAHPQVLAALQWIGIAYLCWIGAQLLFSKATPASSTEVKQQSGWAFFREGFLVCLTNPKAIMFFMAFFPLFMTEHSTGFTLAVMMLHVSLLSLAWQSLLVLAGNAAARHLGHIPGLRQLALRLAGLALLGFGIRLALSDR
jgi:leucine efflux protein